MTDPLQAARQSYAQALRLTAPIRSTAVFAALATVPRERFVGVGPWRIKDPMDMAGYRTTNEADPRAIYHDVLVALDEPRRINNGQPSLWAFLFDQLDIAFGDAVLHLGCGTGYYTAVLAELVGPTGTVTAIEINPALAEKARAALASWPRVKVVNADGANVSPDPADLIIASAGATHPLPAWLDALRQGGRLLFPMTAAGGAGMMLLVKRTGREQFAAGFLCHVGFIDFSGVRDARAGRGLSAALARDDVAAVRSLRRDAHTHDETCWLHGAGWCLSRRPVSIQNDPTPYAGGKRT